MGAFMVDLFSENPLLLLFVVAAIGYPLGRLKIKGFSLGVAAVLFVGLAFGAMDPALGLPEIIYQLGLILFIYSVGITSGPAFFASFKRGGLRENLFVLLLLIFAVLVIAVLQFILGVDAPTSAGLFAGSLTNTPALASVLESLSGRPEAVLAAPVIAYAVCYPVGVIGVIAVAGFFERRFRVDFNQEARQLKDLGASGEHLENLTVRVSNPEVAAHSIGAWRESKGWRVILGRFEHCGEISLADAKTTLHPGDRVSLIGSAADIHKAAAFLGELTDVHLEFDRQALDFRRVFVSDPSVAGKTLAELKLPERYGALVTRVRRGDAEFLPTGEMRLELGDRVRVVTHRERMDELSRFFGDSYKALSEVDILVLGLGIALGLMIGLVPVALPGGVTFKLGMAGGPLLVGLLLGTIGRTGPVVWTLPYSATLTLRQMGLVLFLAGVGTRSGYAFLSTLMSGEALGIFIAGALLTLLLSTLLLVIGYRVLRIPMSVLLGMLAGMQTQPAVLGYASERTRNDLPLIGYATVFPLATISKILLAQLLLMLPKG